MKKTSGKNKRYNPLHILSGNGWEWLHSKNRRIGSTGDDYEQYKINILGDMYTSTVIAIVSQRKEDLELDGHYGVLWLEAIYESELPYTFEAMEDMQHAIILAEENLLKIGMPFTDGYCFHGKNIARKAQRNTKLRKEFNLEELEKGHE